MAIVYPPNIQGIQELINKLAAEKLRDDLCSFRIEIKNGHNGGDVVHSSIWKELSEYNIVYKEETGEEKKVTLHNFLYNELSVGSELLFESLLPRYIEEESKKFFDKIKQFNK